MKIYLTPEELEKCTKFANKCAETQQKKEFGQNDTLPRGEQEIGRDNLIGKIAEVAFAKMLRESFKITIKLDFECYPRRVWDKTDTEINGWRIDIKGTRQGGQWLLVEWNKLVFRQKEENLPHLFVMASVGWDRKNDKPTRSVDLIGSASLQRLRHNVEKTIILSKGRCIPGTKTYLQADNYAIHFKDLELDWSKVIKYIKSNQPPDTCNYPCPYGVS